MHDETRDPKVLVVLQIRKIFAVLGIAKQVLSAVYYARRNCHTSGRTCRLDYSHIVGIKSERLGII